MSAAGNPWFNKTIDVNDKSVLNFNSLENDITQDSLFISKEREIASASTVNPMMRNSLTKTPTQF